MHARSGFAWLGFVNSPVQIQAPWCYGNCLTNHHHHQNGRNQSYWKVGMGTSATLSRIEQTISTIKLRKMSVTKELCSTSARMLGITKYHLLGGC